MLKKVILTVVFLFTIVNAFSQTNVVKLSSISTSNPYNDNFFEFERSSFSASYEYAYANHSALELMVVYCRSISYDETIGYSTVVVPVAGLGAEMKWRYYFQTNPNFITYAPYGWYAAPTVSYTTMEGDNRVIDKNKLIEVPNPNTGALEKVIDPNVSGIVNHSIEYFAVGALAGYQFIMEEYEYGVVFDFGLGFNYIASSKFSESREDLTPDKNGYIEKNPLLFEQKLNKFIPKLHFSIGFTF